MGAALCQSPEAEMSAEKRGGQELPPCQGFSRHKQEWSAWKSIPSPGHKPSRTGHRSTMTTQVEETRALLGSRQRYSSSVNDLDFSVGFSTARSEMVWKTRGLPAIPRSLEQGGRKGANGTAGLSAALYLQQVRSRPNKC